MIQKYAGQTQQIGKQPKQHGKPCISTSNEAY